MRCKGGDCIWQFQRRAHFPVWKRRKLRAGGLKTETGDTGMKHDALFERLQRRAKGDSWPGCLRSVRPSQISRYPKAWCGFPCHHIPEVLITIVFDMMTAFSRKKTQHSQVEIVVRSAARPTRPSAIEDAPAVFVETNAPTASPQDSGTPFFATNQPAQHFQPQKSTPIRPVRLTAR